MRRSRCDGPGISRRRRGKGFAYYYDDGTRVTDPDVLSRISGLVLPPAWRDVWICPWPNGHVQALGTDAAGRRQYRYHDDWRLMRDAEKHERVLSMATVLPQVRETIARDMKDTAEGGVGRRAVLGAAVRLLDLGFFRVGGEAYADEHSTYGLATLRKDHVTIDGDALVFEYDAKGGKHRVLSIVDDDVRRLIVTLKRRRGGGAELLAYKDSAGRWRDVRSGDINDHLRALSDIDMTAKDFRTWHATVLMAVALAVSSSVSTPSGRERAIARAYKEVAGYLGNTPAVCRKSYVDPKVVDLFEQGVTIAPALEKLGSEPQYGLATQGAVEQAVMR
ncbi:MAG TPA: DNA topoisomerase IB, partial [Acidothermaceae bacterium]|nr:DNA topoisomerase IB [Acidothermaceae bacterium]